MVRSSAGVCPAAVVHSGNARQDRGPVHLYLCGVQHHLFAAAAGDRHCAGAEHQGGVHLSAGGHRIRCTAVCQRQSGAGHQHPVLQRRRRHGGQAFGQQQRVAFIRALCQPFDFLFLDEPISHLDDDNSRIMGELIIAEAKTQGAGVIATSIGKHIELPYNHTLQL